MMTLSFALDWGAVSAPVVLWPFLFGVGVYLILTAQPIGRPKPDLAERLRRLDVDERIRMDLGVREVCPIFASRVLEAMLRPVLDDTGYLLQIVLGRFGLAGLPALDRRLSAVRLSLIHI